MAKEQLVTTRNGLRIIFLSLILTLCGCSDEEETKCYIEEVMGAAGESCLDFTTPVQRQTLEIRSDRVEQLNQGFWNYFNGEELTQVWCGDEKKAPLPKCE